MDKTLQAIRAKLGHCPIGWTPSLYIDTGDQALNSVLGHRDKGIPYGPVIEISGWESSGKTATTMSLCGLAQQDGAHIIWGGFEDRNVDERWATIRGLNINQNFTPIVPYVGRFGKEKLPRLSSAQELLMEMEQTMAEKHKKHDRMVAVIDSIAALLPEDEAAAGIDGSNMKTRMSHPVLIGQLMRRWVGLAQWYNCLVIMTNQLREAPKAFSGVYTPGGNAPRFYAQIRVRMWRVKGGKMMSKGRMVGIRGIMRNLKNKAGGVENSEIGYRLPFDGPLSFVDARQLKKECGGDEGGGEES